MKLYRNLTFALFTLAWVTATQAREVPLNELDSLELRFAVAEPVARVPKPTVWGQATYRPGAAFRVNSPNRVQQADYLVEPGRRVEKGQPVVRLLGPEIHHWQVEFDSVKARYRLAEERYQRNKPLYSSQSIPESRWSEIVSQWHALRLEFEHMSHFAELVQVEDAPGSEGLILNAPFDARVTYDATGAAPEQDQLIAAFAPVGALRIRARVSMEHLASLEAFNAAGCVVPVSSTAEQVTGFLVEAWSAPLPETCSLLPGQTVPVTPLYRLTAHDQQTLRVPATALLSWDKQQFILHRTNEALTLRPVTVLTREGTDYLLHAPAIVAGAEVLSSSVSAVQGILMGLGDQ